ncbi:MAG: site-specific integrase, partial [Pseudomonadota bacterium]
KKQLCKSPGFKVELPKANTEKTEDLDPEQLRALLDVIEADPLNPAGPMMKLALFTGMRRGEMFKLQWPDVDFEKGFIHIRDPKGGKDQTIPLNRETRELLETTPRTDSPYVFPGRGGRQRVDIKRPANRIKAAAGIPKDFRALHGLRHVYASMLASSGKVDMFTLQKLLTHKSPMMTQRYAHLRDESLKRASDLAGEIVSGIVSKKESEVIPLRK